MQAIQPTQDLQQLQSQMTQIRCDFYADVSTVLERVRAMPQTNATRATATALQLLLCEERVRHFKYDHPELYLAVANTLRLLQTLPPTDENKETARELEGFLGERPCP